MGEKSGKQIVRCLLTTVIIVKKKDVFLKRFGIWYLNQVCV